jgi:hypothetical protein
MCDSYQIDLIFINLVERFKMAEPEIIAAIGEALQDGYNRIWEQIHSALAHDTTRRQVMISLRGDDLYHTAVLAATFGLELLSRDGEGLMVEITRANEIYETLILTRVDDTKRLIADTILNQHQLDEIRIPLTGDPKFTQDLYDRLYKAQIVQDRGPDYMIARLPPSFREALVTGSFRHFTAPSEQDRLWTVVNTIKDRIDRSIHVPFK